MSTYDDALFSACKYGRLIDIQDLLKDKNTKWNIVDELGNTPLHYAASSQFFKKNHKLIPILGAGHNQIVKAMIMSNKVNPNIQNGHGDTPLHKVLLVLKPTFYN